VMISLRCISPFRARLGCPLPSCSPNPAVLYSWQKSSTEQNSSSKLIPDTSCHGLATCKDTSYPCQEVSLLYPELTLNRLMYGESTNREIANKLEHLTRTR